MRDQAEYLRPRLSGDASTRAARIAGILFITATASTMAAQIVLAPLLDAPQVANDPQTSLVASALLLEITNALASAGIAIALFPVLRRCAELAATGYLGLRIIEGAAGVAVASMMKQGEALGGQAIVVLVCGGNVSRDTLKRIL